MDNEVRDALNAQMNREFSAAYLYLAMAAHFEGESLDGFACWMRLQSQEEVEHAMRIFQYLARRGEPPRLQEIPAPPSEFEAPLSVFEQALEHERKITGHIHDLYELAVQKRDVATRIELDWFVTEQVEEEDSVGAVVDRLRRAGGDPASILVLDRELGHRGEGA
ncbi:MAG: ferritin [Gemmatimonadota bacterium]